MGLAVVVITFQSAGHIDGCLRALLADGVTAGQLVVWDNASTDGSADVAAAIVGEAAVVRSPKNLGFAAAVNRAAALMPGDDLLLVNPDATLELGAVSALRAALADPRVAVVGSRLVTTDGKPSPDSWRYPTPRLAIIGSVVGLGRAYRPRRTAAGEIEYLADAFVPFTAALLRRTMFDSLGGLDEAFWLYGEDSEYCFRAFQQGQSVAIACRALARHDGGASSDEVLRNSAQLGAGDRFREKHFGASRRRVAGNALLLGARLRLATGARRFLEWRHVRGHYDSR